MSFTECVLYFGPRDHGSLWQFVDQMTREPRDVRILSGHARGVDIISEFTALSQGREVQSFPARWRDAGGRKDLDAGFKRNIVMVDRCTRAVGGLWPGCRGSLHTESLLRKSGKPYEMIEPDLKNTGTVLFTSVSYSSRRAMPYSGPGGFDVSSPSTSVGHWFAPSAWLLDRIQVARHEAAFLRDEALARRRMDEAWAEHMPRYLDEMRTLYTARRDIFVNLLRTTNFAVLQCDCPPHHPVAAYGGYDPINMQCHRRLLAQILVAVGWHHGIRVIDGGEVDMHRVQASITPFS